MSECVAIKSGFCPDMNNRTPFEWPIGISVKPILGVNCQNRPLCHCLPPYACGSTLCPMALHFLSCHRFFIHVSRRPEVFYVERVCWTCPSLRSDWTTALRARECFVAAQWTSSRRQQTCEIRSKGSHREKRSLVCLSWNPFQSVS